MSIRNIFFAIVIGFSFNALAMSNDTGSGFENIDVDTAISSIDGTDTITTTR